MNEKTLYCIMYESWEFDDPCNSTSERPIYFTTDATKFESVWKENKRKEIEHFTKFKSEEVNSDYKDDYTIETDNDDELELYMGNWSYRWWKVEYELDKFYK